MRDGEGDLDELVRAERRADAAVKRLGLPPERSRPQAASAVAGILARRREAPQRPETAAEETPAMAMEAASAQEAHP